MSLDEIKEEVPKRQRLTSCTDESNVVHFFETVHPFWYILSGLLHLFVAVSWLISELH